MTTNTLLPYLSLAERVIVRRLVRFALALGAEISVKDSIESDGEWTLRRSSDLTQILRAMGSTGSDFLRFSQGDQRLGWVALVWGNDEDCIHDHADNPWTQALTEAVDQQKELTK